MHQPYAHAARIVLAASLLAGASASSAQPADDAYIRARRNRWTMGTGRVQKVVALKGGALVLKSLRNKLSGREMAGGLAGGARGEEFSVGVGERGERISSASGGWKLVGARSSRLRQGERQLDITLQRHSLRVTKSYIVYPQSSIIREWASFANAGATPLRLSEPNFLSLSTRAGEPGALDFHWMTGGENNAGSWLLKT